MRTRGILILAAVLVVVLIGGFGASYVLSRAVKGSPQGTARDYFAAWERGSLDRMARMVDHPPADFAQQHRALAQALSVTSISFEPGPLVRDGKGQRAHQDFAVSRDVGGHGTWTYRSTLRLGVVGRRWRVIWNSGTLHPGLRGPATWSLTRIDTPAATVVDRAGKALPNEGLLAPYVTALAEEYGETDGEDEHPAWAIEMRSAGQAPQRLKVFGTPSGGKKIRTTFDRGVQRAAELALKSVPSAAIVAVRASTGEILAVADELGGRNAFLGLYPPGSTFKVVTAAGLLSEGMSPGSGAGCPAMVVVGQRTVVNHEGSEQGSTSLRDAFAHSCNTTFAQLAAERLGPDKLTQAGRLFGFGGPITPGLSAARGGFPTPANVAELAEASFGQGRVQASPLVMALVAAAVADGTWRPPRLVDAKVIRKREPRVQSARGIPNAAGLRTMMRAAVTGGTAAQAGLPAGVAGKTGTAEVGGGAPDHAWFIGFQDDLAFAVLVADGGSGPKVAAPLAARFLRAR